MFHRKNATAAAPPPAPPPEKKGFFFDPVKYLVLSPILQSAYIGILAGLATGLPVPILAWWGAQIPNPGKIGVGIGGFLAVVVAFVSFFFLTKWWLKTSENLFQKDINGDGTIGGAGNSAPATTKYLTPVWVHDDPENPDNSRRVDVETPKDDTLERMAVILSVRGWDYFNCDNFTSAKSATKLMSYDHWQDVFFPAMEQARLVNSTTDRVGRKRVELTPMGREMMTKLSGAVDRQ